MARERVTEIVAEMVANVMSVGVSPGEEVSAGDTVVVLEPLERETSLNVLGGHDRESLSGGGREG